jgi:hypothetical protein
LDIGFGLLGVGLETIAYKFKKKVLYFVAKGFLKKEKPTKII